MGYILKYVSKATQWMPRINLTRFKCSGAFVYSEEVSQAKVEGKPLVALESTIITHGMPYPHNLETALQVENIIRERGAIPVTIAILKGQLTVGLTKHQIEYLAKAKGVVKASRRDLAPIAAAGLDGATTVAGTIIAAELAEIPVFVTGGIGGVHREGHKTLDVSADLTELGRSSTLVVCSGVKSILDIGRTLEYLETQGVCVCSFRTHDFPAFYTTRSGHRAPHKVTTAHEAAKILQASHDLHIKSGIVVAVPLPEEYAMDEHVIENAISKALEEAENKGIRGKEVTPFILSAVAAATSGKSLQANIALIKNNAKVGADIAVEFNKLRNVCVTKGGKFGNVSSRRFHTSCSTRSDIYKRERSDEIFGSHRHSVADVLVIGGANVDRTYKATEEHVQMDGSTHPCKSRMSGGGVGRNMAEALWRLRGGRVKLLTAVGDDIDGHYLANIVPGLLLDGCIVKGTRTASYAAVLDANGECKLGLGDMAVHDEISIDLVNRHMSVLKKAPLVVVDGNVPQKTFNYVLTLCNELKIPVFFEPTDRRKAGKFLYGGSQKITFSSPNVAELQTMAAILHPNIKVHENMDLEEILSLCVTIAEHIDFILVTLGSKGVLTVRKGGTSNSCESVLRAKLYEVEALKSVKSVSGAGDCFASGFIYGFLSGLLESQCISYGIESAKHALATENTIPPLFNIRSKEAHFRRVL